MVEIIGLMTLVTVVPIFIYWVFNSLFSSTDDYIKSQESVRQETRIKKSIDYDLMNTLDQYHSTRNFGSKSTKDWVNYED